MSLQNSIDNLSPKIISSIAETKLRTEQPIIVLEIPSLRANLKATIIINKRAKTKIFSEISLKKRFYSNICLIYGSNGIISLVSLGAIIATFII